MKLCGCRFLYFFSLCDVRNEAVFLLLEHSSPRGVNQEKHVKKREILGFKPLLQEIRLKNLTGRRFSEVLTSKLWNKKNTYFWSLPKWSEFELYSPPYGFIKNLRQIRPRDSHMKFTGKNKVGNTTWAKFRTLIGPKRQNSFQQTHAKNFFVSIRWAGKQALGLQLSFL